MLACLIVILAVLTAIYWKRKDPEQCWKVAFLRAGLVWCIGVQGVLAAIAYQYFPNDLATWLGYFHPEAQDGAAQAIIQGGALAVGVVGLLHLRRIRNLDTNSAAIAGFVFFNTYVAGYLTQNPPEGWISITLASLAWTTYFVVPLVLLAISAWISFQQWRSKS
ncbi:MAG: hypothetical protein ACOYKZ_03780 [Chlamydiia bacterium]